MPTTYPKPKTKTPKALPAGKLKSTQILAANRARLVAELGEATVEAMEFTDGAEEHEHLYGFVRYEGLG